jgi:hypothetical protein
VSNTINTSREASVSAIAATGSSPGAIVTPAAAATVDATRPGSSIGLKST